MREELVMPEWAVVGATAYVIHHYSGVTGGYGMPTKWEIDRVTKTQVTVGADRSIWSAGKITGTERVTRKFKLHRGWNNSVRLEEMGGRKYNEDWLVANESKIVRQIRNDDAVKRIDNRIRNTANELVGDRWLDQEKITKTINQLMDLRTERLELEAEREQIEDMSLDDYVAG